MSSDLAVSVWDRVIGQDDAVRALRGSVANPVHAYLFVGRPGWGTEAAAVAFSAALVSDGLAPEAAERAARLALERAHPDVELFEPEGAYLRVEEAEAIIRAASLSPVEGARKVLVLTEFQKVREVGPKLLKTIEEPPASTVFVVLADEVPDELVTIASRAVRIDFRPLAIDVVVDALVADGAAPDQAEAAARGAAGDLARARVLVTDERLALRQEAWRSTPSVLSGQGGAAWERAAELLAHIDDAQSPLEAEQARETEALRDQIETYGQRTTPLKHLADRHKRSVRRHRTDELRFGLATLAAVYRDALADSTDPGPLLDAIDAITDAAEALVRNPNETLLLQALLARLPPLRA